MLRLLIENFICATENEEQEKAIVLSEGASFEKKEASGLIKVKLRACRKDSEDFGSY